MANEKISNLPASGTITGAELVPVVQTGSNKKATVDQLKAYVGAMAPASAVTGTHNETATTGEKTLLANAAGGNVLINLPTAVGNLAKFHIKRIDSSVNSVTIDPNGAQTIDGETTKNIAFQWSSMTIVSNGSNWVMI